MRRTIWLAAVSLSLALLEFAGCEPDRSCSAEMIDSVGARYPTDGVCVAELGPQSAIGMDCREGQSAGVVFMFGRLASACSACDAGYLVSADCRPLVCETDDDCPIHFLGTVRDLVEYGCRSGLCQNLDDARYPYPPQSLDSITASLLCDAEQPRGTAQPSVCWDGSQETTCSLPLPEWCWSL